MLKRSRIAVSLALAGLFFHARADTAEIPAILQESPPQQEARIGWWRNARFGMFIHYGVYAIPERGEWVQWKEQIPVEEYAKLAERFKPERSSAEQWAAAAKAGGMKYMVLTARHHDGFSLFDSKASYRDFTSVNSAAHRDIVAEYVKAAHRAGLRAGLYYSPLDWRFPGYFFPGIYRSSAEAMKQQTYDQMRELMTRYGTIDLVWWDGGSDDWLGFGGLQWDNKKGWHPRDRVKQFHYTGKPLWQENQLNAMVRELQPQIIINNRAGRQRGADWPGDFEVRENEKNLGDFQMDRPWELCITLNGMWGWRKGGKVLPLKEVIQTLTRTVGRDGNLLLNVGPMPNGEIEPAQRERLNDIGGWLGRYGQSIYGTRGGPYKPGQGIVSTRAGNIVYLHVLRWAGDSLALPPLGRKIARSELLTGGTPAVRQDDKSVVISVRPQDRHAITTIIKLELDGPALDIAPIETGPEPDAVSGPESSS